MDRWVALVRGINVGGGNKISMADLRSTASDLGWKNVTTYIQTGNLVFDAADDEADLADQLSAAMRERHGLAVPVVVRAAADIVRIAEAHPDGGGDIDPKFLHVQLLDRAPDADAVAAVATDAYLPDTWALDGREIYLAYPNGSGRSKLGIEVFERAWGVTATARNLRTIRKLAELAQE